MSNEYAYMITTETGFSYQLRLGCCCCPVSSDPRRCRYLEERTRREKENKKDSLHVCFLGRLTMAVEMLLLMLVRARCDVLSLDCAINLTSIRFPLNRLFVCVWFVV